MQIKPLTALMDLQYRNLARKFAQWYEGWAAELGVAPDLINDQLVTYLWVALRVNPDENGSKKVLVSPDDDEAKAKKKFFAFLDLELATTNPWVMAMNEFDRPANPVLAPDAVILESDEKN